MEEFHYRIPWRSGSAHPGHHKSRASGGGYEFHGHTSLINAGDPRHLDVRASLSAPFGQYRVRQFLQTSIIPVMILADLSASLAIGCKPMLLARISAAIAHSARRTGDPCGFIGIAENDRPGLTFPLRRHKMLGLTLVRELNQFPFRGTGLTDKIQWSTWLGRRKSLVFLMSDFHFPLATLESILQQLHPHDVVPVVLWLQEEWTPPVRWGVARLKDPESKTTRLLWLHPAKTRELEQRFQKRRGQITQICQHYGRPPFFVVDTFQPDALNRYFLETCA